MDVLFFPSDKDGDVTLTEHQKILNITTSVTAVSYWLAVHPTGVFFVIYNGQPTFSTQNITQSARMLMLADCPTINKLHK